MTSDRIKKLEEFQRQTLEQLAATNAKLDKIAAILLSSQLLEECVSPEGEVRTAEECADIVRESFCAGLCMSQELNSNQKEFEYHVSEFYIDEDEEEEADECDEDDDDDEPEQPQQNFSVRF